MKNSLKRTLLAASVAGIFAVGAVAYAATTNSSNVIETIDAWAPYQAALEHDIWLHPEIAFQEYHTSRLQQKALAAAGFKVEAGVAGMPTAYIATYGSGEPVIGIATEMDALPGMSQERVATHQPIAGQGPGHADGHNLLGMAGVAAGRAVAKWLKATGTSGTVKIFGSPAEESGSGKVYMIKAGLFEGTDAVFSWHPIGGINTASQGHDLALASGKWTFHGVAAHAGGEPWAGRSALHAAESFAFMVNVMRETTPDFTRLQYIYTKGGDEPNTIPDLAQVSMYIRAPSVDVVRKLLERVQEAAKGAAMGNQVTVTFEATGGTLAQLDNETLGQVMDESLRTVGGVHLSGEARDFAEKVYATLDKPPPFDLMEKVLPFHVGGDIPGGYSSDIGDVSWNVPEAGALCSTWAPGTANHSWQAAAQSGGPIGSAGALNCAKVMALSAVKLFQSPGIVEKAHEELLKRRGPDWHYEPLTAPAKPDLDSELSNQYPSYKNLDDYEKVMKSVK